MTLKNACLGLSLMVLSTVSLADKPTIRLGVLAFGTVNWELSALNHANLLKNATFKLEVTPVATPQAGKIALQSNAVDMIVSDWIWVSAMRNKGEDYTFYPYSNTAGALMVPENSPIQSLSDLQSKKLGIAGGELDKNWLLLRALAERENIDLKTTSTLVYGAPPLLNKQLEQNRIDAVINYWHFAARLEAKGYRQIMNGREILQKLGIAIDLPALGYVFRSSWAAQHKPALTQFLQLTQQAKNQLCNDDNAWKQISPLTKTDWIEVEQTIRHRYCEGRVKQWGLQNQKAANQVFQWLGRVSDNRLTGSATQLAQGTFWQLD